MAIAYAIRAPFSTLVYLSAFLSLSFIPGVSSEPGHPGLAHLMEQQPLHGQSWHDSLETSRSQAWSQVVEYYTTGKAESAKLDVENQGQRKWESEGMTYMAEKFTPEVMLSAPRRSGALPNSDGTYALYTVSTYSFEAAKKTKEIRLFDIRRNTSTLITNDDKAREPHWLEDSILYLREGENEDTELIVASLEDSMQPYRAAIIPGTISDLKLKVLERGKVAVLGTARATHEGKIQNAENEVKRNHSGVVYDSTFVRHWDYYVDTTKNALWYGLITRDRMDEADNTGPYIMSPLINALKDTELESPIPPFPGSDHYDIGSEGIVFVAKDPDLNPAFHTKCNFYTLHIPNFGQKPPGPPRKIQAKGLEGAATGPVISPNGKMAIYMQMKKDGYEADRNRVLLVQDLTSDDPPLELFTLPDGRDLWDRSPSKAVWGLDGRQIFLLAEHYGRVAAWFADLNTIVLPSAPRILAYYGSINDITPVSDRIVFLSGSSFVDNSFWGLADVQQLILTVISSNTNHGAAIGLSGSQVSSVTFIGAKGRPIQAWVVRPNGHDSSSGKKLPLAMAIHGGPQGAWDDAWSTRWNPAVLAEQGYVVVAPNPTGSTGYGQALTDAIRDDWGGDPYEDIVKCFEAIRDKMSDVDIDRAVALGASYGGYMINWIQGHDLGRKFKALVCHDGIFSTDSDVAQDEQYFPIHDHKGPFWEVPKKWHHWSPANHVDQWATPELIIHSEKDYRLAMPEGLAAFNVLQGKGIESRLLYFPDENHWVLKEENSRVWHTVVLNWLNKHVGLPEYADEERIVGPPVGRKYHEKRA